MTLDALMARQKEIASRQGDVMGMPVRSIPQGLAQLAWSAVDAMQANKAAEQETDARQRLATIMAGIDLDKGPTAQQIADVGQIDPDLQEKLYAGALSSRQAAQKLAAEQANANVLKPSDVNSMRGQVFANKNYQAAETMVPIYKSMMKSASDKSGPDGMASKASDLDLVYGLATLLDPGSVVRQSDAVMVTNAQGLTDQMLSWINTVNGGTALGDDVRKQIMDLAHSRTAEQVGAYNDFAKWYRDAVTSSGGDPSKVVPDFGPIDPWVPEAAAPAPADTGGGGGGGDPAKPAPAPVQIDSFPAPSGTPEGDIYKADDGSVWVAHNGKYTRQKQVTP